jgi:hypothetical protein
LVWKRLTVLHHFERQGKPAWIDRLTDFVWLSNEADPNDEMRYLVAVFAGAVNFFCNLPVCFFQEEVNETNLEIDS